MRLKAYLSLEGNSASKLAEEVGVAVSTITRAASGETLPNPPTRKRILEATGGAVTAADLFAEHEEHLVKAA
ncbi:MAG: helix-turn-helix domain-containing protein [Sphingopyxis terrae]|uniref:helix-turn-helix domain-containing protein n=1 Tax=Sphingopyxis terrae TaxID=33052 RepID=UPI003F806F8E